MSPKIDLEYENGKLLQVTIIKITESKENKSIQCVWLNRSREGKGTGLFPPCPPPLAMALRILRGTRRGGPKDRYKNQPMLLGERTATVHALQDFLIKQLVV